MKKYRVRKGMFNKSVLQVLQTDGDKFYWIDVHFDSAPRALGSYDDYIQEIHQLEIDLAEVKE